MHRILESYAESINPKLAGVIGTVATGANAAVALDAIKGWAGTVTMLIGVPTALLMLAYWAIKVRNEWKKSEESND